MSTAKQNLEQDRKDDRYDTDTTVWHSTVSDAAGEWLNYKYPLASRSHYEAGTLLASDNLLFKQHDDGCGHVQHKNDTCAIRTPDGVVLFNTTCDPGDSSMHCRWRMSNELRNYDTPHEALPFDFIEELVAAETDIEPNSFMDGIVEASQNGGSTYPRGGNDSPGVLLKHESGHDVYIGRDSSSHRDNELFGFVVPPRVTVESGDEAIDLLKPDAIQDIPPEKLSRQGEWWLIPTEETPSGTIQQPGVGSRPFGSSPLDNHIPREWATACTDKEFLDRVSEALSQYPDIDCPDSPQDVVELIQERVNDPTFQITFHDIQTLADGIFVRGTLRHDKNEHYVEKIEDWHRTVTHDWEVYTADDEYQARLD